MSSPGTKLLAIVVPWRGGSDLAPALAALTALNIALMRLYPLAPLYKTGVRYQREGRKSSGTYRERWLCAHEVLRKGIGDCEDLASWRAAELRLHARERATAIALPTSIGWHIVVRRSNGQIEDPSRKLGMR